MKHAKPQRAAMAIPTFKPQGIKGRGREHVIEYLIKENNWSYGCELGVWKGRTFLHLLQTCPNLTLVGVDLWEPQPDNDGPENYIHWKHDTFEQQVRTKSARFGERAILYKMMTHEAVQYVEEESLDFVFIDADHSSKAVEADILNWTPKVKPNGYIIGHDINWDTVQPVVEQYFPQYEVAVDNVWFQQKPSHWNH